MTTPNIQNSPTLLKPIKPVGIVGYGAYVPRYRLPAKEGELEIHKKFGDIIIAGSFPVAEVVDKIVSKI